MNNNSILPTKNNSIEFLRFLFMSILVAWHGGFHFFAHGYLVVEFFFILSGYFIYMVTILFSALTRMFPKPTFAP